MSVKRYVVDNPREDLGPEKVGRYLPGTHIMVLASDYDEAVQKERDRIDRFLTVIGAGHGEDWRAALGCARWHLHHPDAPASLGEAPAKPAHLCHDCGELLMKAMESATKSIREELRRKQDE